MVDPISNKVPGEEVRVSEDANVANPSTFQQFKAKLAHVDPAFGAVADLFPKNIKSFNVSGNAFTVTYAHNQKSNEATHPNAELNQSLKRVNVYAQKTISGKINLADNSIQLEPDSLRAGIKKIPGRFSIERVTIHRQSEFRGSGEMLLKALEGNKDYKALREATRSVLSSDTVTETARGALVDDLTAAYLNESKKENPDEKLLGEIIKFKADLSTADLDRISTDLKVHTSPVLGKTRSQRLSRDNVSKTQLGWRKA